MGLSKSGDKYLNCPKAPKRVMGFLGEALGFGG